MADPSTFYEIIGKALTDETFKQQLIDPATRAAALESIGVESSDELNQAIDDAINGVGDLSDAVRSGAGRLVTRLRSGDTHGRSNEVGHEIRRAG